MIPFLFNENWFSFFFVADHLLVGQLCKIPSVIGAFYHIWKWHNVQRVPGLASEGVLRLCTLLSLALLLPRPEPAGLLRLVIRREHHQHDLPQHQSQPHHHHPPSICRAPAGTCDKGMLPVPDPYRGSDWGWRQLHWIDDQVTWIDFFNKSFKIKLKCYFL